MTNEEFREYKEKYEDLTFSDLQDWHERLWSDYPNQSYYDLDAIKAFFNGLPRQVRGLRVVEMGGWCGELAHVMLPGNKAIASWTNYEVCMQARSSPICKDRRYSAPIMKSHMFGPRKNLKDFNVFVSSHSLEHISTPQMNALFKMFKPIEYVYIDSPLTPEGGITEGTDFHVLRAGWNEVALELRKIGFAEVGSSDTATWFHREKK